MNKLIEALKKIEQFSDIGNDYAAVVKMKSIATDARKEYESTHSIKEAPEPPKDRSVREGDIPDKPNSKIHPAPETFTRDQMERCFYAARERVDDQYYNWPDPTEYLSSLTSKSNG